MTELGNPIEILLVEDNPGDVRLTKEALTEAKVHNTLSVVNDGVQAIEYLRGQNGYESATRPDIIFLDLNLPRKSGQEVLAEIKQDESLKSIPVVILTTSSADQDIAKSYACHANCYITKPVEMDGFIKAVKCVEDFWFTVVRLPQP